MHERRVVVRLPLGLHAKPAAEFAKRAQAYPCDVWLETDDGRSCDAKSVFGVLGLNITVSELVCVSADGPGEERAVDALAKFLLGTYNSGSSCA